MNIIYCTLIEITCSTTPLLRPTFSGEVPTNHPGEPVHTLHPTIIITVNPFIVPDTHLLAWRQLCQLRCT